MLKGAVSMPRGEELKQLPVSNTLTGISTNRINSNREESGTIITDEQPQPAKVKKAQK